MRLKADCAEPLAQRCCAHQPRRRPTWTTRHPARFKKHADCRPLLQQSLPNRGRVVQPGKRAAFPSAAHLGRLTDRHSICTAAGALSGEPTAHTWNVRPQAPTPAASFSLLLECSLIHHPRALLGGLFLDTRCLLSVFEPIQAKVAQIPWHSRDLKSLGNNWGTS